MCSRDDDPVVFQPATLRYLQRGVATVANAIAPTLGPIAGTVVVAPVTSRSPEILDDAGLIARRMIQLPNRHEDVGAMFLRGALWRVFQEAGDGVATACVLFRAIFDGGVRAIASGVSASELRRGLNAGARIVLAELEQMARAIDGDSMLLQLAQTAAPDGRIAASVAEVFSIAGPYGHVEVREARDESVSYQFINGGFWKSDAHSPAYFRGSPDRRVDIVRPLILVSDLDITSTETIRAVVQAAKRRDCGGMVLISRSLSEDCINAILQESGDEFPMVSVRTPDLTRDTHFSILRDIELFTGAVGLHASAGDALSADAIHRAGRARYAWADRSYFGIVGHAGDPRNLRHHLHELETQCESTRDTEARDQLLRRISRLSGRTAVMWTPPKLKRAAERAANTVRAGISGGVVPGGGASLIACQQAVSQEARQAQTRSHQAALQILHDALEAPTRTMLINAGRQPSTFIQRLNDLGAPSSWDIRTDTVANALESGVLDPMPVIATAVRIAVEGAAQALTIDTLVHPISPEFSINP